MATYHRIPKLTDPRIIRTFFGEAAKPYDYRVSVEEFDEYDNEVPGEYYGVEVPAELAHQWDAGIDACKQAGVKAASREGYTLRWRLWTEGDDDALPQALVDMLDERDAARLEKDRPRKEWEEGNARLAEIVAGLSATGYGPSAYRCRTAPSGWAIHWHRYCHTADEAVAEEIEELGEPMLVVRDKYAASGQDVDSRPIRRMLWQTRHGYFVLNPTINGQTHYASPDQVRKWRLKWASLNGVDRDAAQRGVSSEYIGDDQRGMYQAVIDA